MRDKPLLFDQSLQKLNILFILSGLNLQRQIKTITDVLKYRCVYTMNVIWLSSAVIASIYLICLGKEQGKDFFELTRIEPCTIIGILSMFKAHTHLINEAKVSNLIESMRKLERDEIKRKTSVEKNKIVAEDIKFLNRVINVLCFINCAMVLIDMLPLIPVAVKYIKTNELKLVLPFMNVFEFIPYKVKYWPFAYVHQIWTECIIILDIGAVDYLFITCCTHITIQFRLLQHDIETVISESDIRKGISDEDFQLKLTELVMWHQNIIGSSMILETTYSKSNLFNFLSSSLLICVSGFNVSIVDDIYVVVTFIAFLTVGLVQVFFVCFFADMMARASVDVSDAVYNCRWYETSVRAGKALLLVQTRSQKPCQLTAFGFADMNLQAFMRILSTSWSYFALLQTIYGSE